MAVPLPIRQPRADRARQVADVLRQQIHAGAYDDGLPGETELADQFAMSRNTVREALATLKNEGLIERGPKVGTRVAQRKYDHDLDTLLGLKETFKSYGEVHNEVRAAMTVSAPPTVAQRLKLEHGQQVVFVERLRYLGGLPPTASRSSSSSPAAASARHRWRWKRFRPTRIPPRHCRCPTARRC